MLRFLALILFSDLSIVLFSCRSSHCSFGRGQWQQTGPRVSHPGGTTHNKLPHSHPVWLLAGTSTYLSHTSAQQQQASQAHQHTRLRFHFGTLTRAFLQLRNSPQFLSTTSSMSFRRGRTRNYGELSQPGRGTTPGNHQSRERSLSPDGRPTPLSHPSNPVRFRSQTARPGTPTAVSSDGQSPSSAFALESRTVSASSDRSTTSSITLELPSLGFPPNLANARHRIASNSSVHSSASVGSGTSVGSYLAGPRVYQPGFSPLEACLPVYPVISQILRYLSTRYILPLHTVSKAFKAYMDSTYISHWSELVLCKERQWIPCVYTPRTARERVELETVYRHIRQYVYWRVDEEERALKNVRNRYDYEVAFMLDRELCLESKFVSGGRRTIWDIKYQRERNVRRSIIGGSRLEFEPGEIAYRKEITRPRVFFNKGVHGNHITRAMMFAATQLQRAVNPQNMSPLQFVKTLVIDGSNIDMPSLAVALDLSQVNGRGRLEALSACACTNLNLVRWARYLESSPRALRQLKSLRVSTLVFSSRWGRCFVPRY